MDVADACRTKRRRHSSDVDRVVSLLSQLSSLDAAQQTTDNVSLLAEKNIELLNDIVTKLHEMLTAPHAHSTQLCVDVSTLRSTLQVGVFTLRHIVSMRLFCYVSASLCSL